jgi:glutaredoxin
MKVEEGGERQGKGSGVWNNLLRWLRRGRPAKAAVIQLTFYTRRGCHLCEEAWDLLRKYQGAYSMAVEEVEIDSDPALAAQFGDKVPVIAIGGRPRLWGKINEVLLRRLLTVDKDRAQTEERA